MAPRADLRMRFLLLRWELAAGQWDEALRSVEGLYGRLARRGILGGPVAGWVFLARAVAQFQVGEGTRYRRSLARVLRAARRGRCAPLREAAIRVGAAVEALGRAPGERRRILSRLAARLDERGEPGPATGAEPDHVPVGPMAALARWLRGDADTSSPSRPFRWIDLPSTLEGPRRFRSALTAARGASLLLAASAGAGDASRDSSRGEDEGEGHGEGNSDSDEDAGALLVDAWLAGVAARPRRRLPAWIVPLLSRFAGDRIPEEGLPRREELQAALGSLVAQLREPWARALALEAVAEGRLWQIDPGDRSVAIRQAELRLVEARADLALAAGMFRKAGWNARADGCERQWARLALPVLGPQVAESATAEMRPWNGAAPDLGRVQRVLAEAGFVTGDPRTLRELAPVFLLASTPLPVLILGESGTGKEVLARALHRWSRVRGELVAIHCGAIPRDLLESELFGHARGAFTGAAADKPGLIEAADGGTLFLDEIGEMGPEAQMKMLRVLESGEVRRLGELRPRRVTLRLVAATHRDLGAEVERGAFRLDLFHRIRGVTVRARPLRERRGDIPLLAGRFLSATGGDGLRLTPGGLACLVAHAWPGNVRELRAAVQRAVHLARALGRSAISPALLGLAAAAPGAMPTVSLASAEGGGGAGEGAGPQACPGGPTAGGPASDCLDLFPSPGAPGANSPEHPGHVPGMGTIPEAVRVDGLDAYLDAIQRRIIVRALEESGWNRTHAARDLGGLSRTTLIGKIRRLGIEAEEPARGAGGEAAE
jgi:DNA-binding NtrC family response regulator